MLQELKVGEFHEAIIQHMVDQPSASPSEVAKAFGVSQQWLSIIVNSDLFQERLRRQRASDSGDTLSPPGTAPTPLARLAGAVEVGLDVLVDRIEKSRNSVGAVPDESIRSTVALALEGLGYGPKARAASAAAGRNAPGVLIDQRQITVVEVDHSVLESARQKMAAREIEQTMLPDASLPRTASAVIEHTAAIPQLPPVSDEEHDPVPAPSAPAPSG